MAMPGSPSERAALRVTDRDGHERWWRRGACLGMDVGLFYPVGPAQDVSIALAVCQRCPVRMMCLAVALCTGEPYGVWGGLTEDERRKVPHEVRGNMTAALASASLLVHDPSKAQSAPACRGATPDRVGYPGRPASANTLPRGLTPFPAGVRVTPASDGA